MRIRERRYHEVRLGDSRLLYRQFGAGPPLLLVHGLAGSSRWWRHNVTALAHHFTVYLVDLVGYGSNRALRPLGIESAADSLAGFIGALPAGRAHVVGHSMGGQIATHLAGRYPERVDRLVLAAASGLVRADLLRMMLRLPRATRYARLDFAPTLAFDSIRSGPFNLLMSAIDLLSNDVSESLANIIAPTLLIWGANDKLVPLAVGEAVQRTLPGARLEVIERAGHVVMWDAPATFNRLVLDFLREETPVVAATESSDDEEAKTT